MDLYISSIPVVIIVIEFRRMDSQPEFKKVLSRCYPQYDPKIS